MIYCSLFVSTVIYIIVLIIFNAKLTILIIDVHIALLKLEQMLNPEIWMN